MKGKRGERERRGGKTTVQKKKVDTPHLLSQKKAKPLSSVCMYREIMRENRQKSEGDSERGK